MSHTPDQHEPLILEFVLQYQQTHGHAPTYREIGAAVGLYSLDHVSRDLKRLVKSGALTLLPRPAGGAQCGKRQEAYAPRYKCSRCHIRISTPTGQCEDCAGARPLITYAEGEGEDRYFQRRPVRSMYVLQTETQEKHAREAKAKRICQNTNSKASTA